jgi:hypothetical protein
MYWIAATLDANRQQQQEPAAGFTSDAHPAVPGWYQELLNQLMRTVCQLMKQLMVHRRKIFYGIADHRLVVRVFPCLLHRSQKLLDGSFYCKPYVGYLSVDDAVTG